jgi:hypothetical protein
MPPLIETGDALSPGPEARSIAAGLSLYLLRGARGQSLRAAQAHLLDARAAGALEVRSCERLAGVLRTLGRSGAEPVRVEELCNARRDTPSEDLVPGVRKVPEVGEARRYLAAERARAVEQLE